MCSKKPCNLIILDSLLEGYLIEKNLLTYPFMNFIEILIVHKHINWIIF